MLIQPWDPMSSAASIGEAGTSSTGVRVTTSAVGEASASEAAVEVGPAGVGVGPGTEEG